MGRQRRVLLAGALLGCVALAGLSGEMLLTVSDLCICILTGSSAMLGQYAADQRHGIVMGALIVMSALGLGIPNVCSMCSHRYLCRM